MNGARRWAVVLAGGRGTRLARLTTVAGETIPKQYWALAGGPSMLRCAIARATAFAGPGQVLVVVTEDQRRYWEPELRDLPARNIVVQPSDRGTAAGLMAPLAEVLRRDPHAIVAFLPADHHVDQEAALAGALAFAATTVSPERPVALIGVRPTEPDQELGWILTGSRAASGAYTVERFHEKPSAAEASALLVAGALVNTFVLVADAEALWKLCEESLPAVAKPLAAAGTDLAQAYPTLPTHDFSRAILQACPERLVAVDAGTCGWSDLGTVTRVVECLCRMSSVVRPVAEECPLDLRRQLGFAVLAGAGPTKPQRTPAHGAKATSRARTAGGKAVTPAPHVRLPGRTLVFLALDQAVP